MSVTIIASLKVADFDISKAGFNAHASARAGVDAKAYQNIDDPNNAIAIVTALSKEAIDTLFTKSEMQEVRKKAGVLAPPEMKFLKEAEFDVYGISSNTKAPHVWGFLLRQPSAVLIQ